MAMQLTMTLTEDLLKETKLTLKLKRQQLEILNRDRAKLINEIVALCTLVCEPDIALIEHNKIMAEMVAGDEQC
jgi:hypothetical protein